jgi:hypothetical protein
MSSNDEISFRTFFAFGILVKIVKRLFLIKFKFKNYQKDFLIPEIKQDRAKFLKHILESLKLLTLDFLPESTHLLFKDVE